LQYLEKIYPSYFELLNPLRKWRILSINALKEESEYSGSSSAFYKVITKLEKNMLLDSFINSWSNEKFVYLLPTGIKALGEEKASLAINRDLRFHDAISSKIARLFKSYSFINGIYLNQEIAKSFPLLERVPDILAEGKITKEFRLAIEVELTQKSQKRVKQIFKSYSDSKVVNNIIYITDKQSIFKAYKKYLIELGAEINQAKFIIIFESNLSKKTFNLLNSKAYYKDIDTSLNNIFKLKSENAITKQE
jgi:hypothetical protein